jgi:hypothetical protein
VPEYLYLGSAQATYTQYLAVSEAGTSTLVASPGEAYDMHPVPGYEDEAGVSVLPVPPGDGLWSEVSPKLRLTPGSPAAKTAPASKRKGA